MTALALFHALADPTRMRILVLVDHMELSVGELAHILCQSQPRVSRHVKILVDAGLVTRHREGAWVFLRPNEANALIEPARAVLDGCAEAVERTRADLTRLAAVRAERAAAAERYFSNHAEAWDALRSLHVAEAEVEAAILAAMRDRPLGTLVDIGTGTGRMLELLAPRATRAFGIDRNPEMLRIARSKLDSAGLGQVQVRQADMFALPFDSGSADTVMLHQVLHYADAPAEAIAEAARLVAPGGRLVVVDFAPHGLEELRERHAHARLGFETQQLLGWMRAAGLDARAAGELRGGALTVTIWVGERAPLSLKDAA